MKIFLGALAGASLLSTGVLAAGNTLHVANNGTDSLACGAANDTCRSISQAIANALAGDTILVRPGRYGDLDENGVLGGVGEETGNPDPASQGAVFVSKSLTIVSTTGAEATYIDAGETRQAAVELAANGIRFGDRGRGFSLRGGQAYGLYAGSRANLVIAGNHSSGHPFAGFQVSASGPIELRGNTAIGNSSGFTVAGFLPAEAVNVIANHAIGNQYGIQTGGIAPHRITSNVVSGNSEWGILINWGALRVSNNQITGNRRGVQVNSTSDANVFPVFTRNNIVGNEINGFDVIMGKTGSTVRLRENNIFGNGWCGVTNQWLETLTVDARQNYWGAATGPSFQDPADPACVGNQPILTVPFAAVEFDVR